MNDPVILFVRPQAIGADDKAALRSAGVVVVEIEDLSSVKLMRAAICDEVTHPKTTQRSVALSYAFAIKAQAQGVEKPDWERINRAILTRWKMSGLERIKKRALDLCRGKVQP